MDSEIENPKIATVSGFTKEACQTLLNNAQTNMNDVKFIDQLNVTYKKYIDGHQYRGYTILGQRNSTEIDYFLERKPIWFLFTGYGGYWPGMGKDFMKVQPFKNSILRSAKVLEPKGVNLIELIFNSKKETENVMNTIILITATQIGLADVYTTLGIKPDGIIGISVGEIACAYADGCLTHEQSILSAYWRGTLLKEMVLVPGRLAKVSLSWEEAAKLCPSDLYLSVSYDGRCVFVGGPENSIRKFVNDLNCKQIRASLTSYPLAFHTKYLSDVGITLKETLEEIIKNPKQRSSKWLSTSVPESDWGTFTDRFCSADYFVNNLVKPVLLYETVKHIPSNALIIQVTLDIRKLLKDDFANFMPGQSTRLHSNVNNLIHNIGKLYNVGSLPDTSKLFSPLNQYSCPFKTNTVRRYHTGQILKGKVNNLIYEYVRDFKKIKQFTIIKFAPRVERGMPCLTEVLLKAVNLIKRH